MSGGNAVTIKPSRIILAIVISAIFADVIGAIGGVLVAFSYAAAFEKHSAQELIKGLAAMSFILPPVMIVLGIPGAFGVALCVLTPVHMAASRFHATKLGWYVFAGMTGGFAALYFYAPFYSGFLSEKYLPLVCGACLSGGFAAGIVYWKVAVKWHVPETAMQSDII